MEPVNAKCPSDGLATIVFLAFLGCHSLSQAGTGPPSPGTKALDRAMDPLGSVETWRETVKGETVNCFIGE